MADGLPDGFEDLLPFIDWARPTEMERNAKRWSATMAESRAFYDAMLARGAAAMDYLGQVPLDAIAGDDLTLLNLCLAVVLFAASRTVSADMRRLRDWMRQMVSERPAQAPAEAAAS